MAGAVAGVCACAWDDVGSFGEFGWVDGWGAGDG